MRGLSLRSLGIVATAALFAFACGGSGGGTGGGNANKGTIKIGVDLPESGSEASDGVPTLHGIQYAVDQTGSIDGFKLAVDNHDDAPSGAHDPNVGASNVRTMIADTDVLGMIGPFNSSVAKVEIPIANQANLAIISPANTNPCLTKNIAACNAAGGYHPADLRPSGTNNYFRVAATDDHQGGALADYVYQTVGIKKVGVIDDNEVYGYGIAHAFADEFKKDGGTVVSIQDSDTSSESSFAAVINTWNSQGAEAVYFGGTTSTKGCIIRNQMTGIMDPASHAFMGGDGIVDATCLDNAAAAAKNMYGTVAAADATKIQGAADTISAIKAKFPGNNGYGAYTIPAYSATKILLAAIKKAIESNNGNKPSRAQVVSALSSLSGISTPLGTISFDKNGDTSQQIISIYKVDNNASAANALVCSTTATSTCWVYVKQVNYSGG
jgi:branched-chain amino acid transport system substrate-binding protein